jgi:hypothetical protein
MYLAVRSQVEPQSLNAPIQAAVHAVDSQIPLYEVRTMEDRMQRAVVSQRAAMILLSAFAFVAMLLAVVGIYGVISGGPTHARDGRPYGIGCFTTRRDVVGRSFFIRSWPGQDAVAIWSEGVIRSHLLLPRFCWQWLPSLRVVCRLDGRQRSIH